MSRRATLRLLLLGLLLCWCGVFLRSENTEKALSGRCCWNRHLSSGMWHCSINSRRLRLIPRMRLLPCSFVPGPAKRWSRPSLRRRSICPSGPATACVSICF